MDLVTRKWILHFHELDEYIQVCRDRKLVPMSETGAELEYWLVVKYFCQRGAQLDDHDDFMMQLIHYNPNLHFAAIGKVRIWIL